MKVDKIEADFEVRLILSKREAELLKALCGGISGPGEINKGLADPLYWKLVKFIPHAERPKGTVSYTAVGI